MFKRLWLPCLPCILTLASATLSHAGLFYDMVAEGGGEVLAKLEFSRLPTAEPADILNLYFTPAGEAIYGFGSHYTGAFDINLGRSPVDESSEGTLRAIGLSPAAGTPFYDNDPPLVAGNPDDATLALFFRYGAGLSSLLTMPPRSRSHQPELLDPDGSTLSYGRGASGTWVRSIPEPSSILVLAAVFVLGMPARVSLI